MSDKSQRATLTRERILSAAVELADDIGIDTFTIRKLATALDTAPMSIYHHIASKEEIIDGLVDIVFSEIELPPTDSDWKSAIRRRCISTREVLNRHPWAAPLMESRLNPGPATLRHHDAVLGCLRNGGLSLQMTAHAYAILDSYLYGFALEEAMLPAGGGEGFSEIAAQIAENFPVDDYPHLGEFTIEHALRPGYSFGESFEFGLDLILDGIDQHTDT